MEMSCLNSQVVCLQGSKVFQAAKMSIAFSSGAAAAWLIAFPGKCRPFCLKLLSLPQISYSYELEPATFSQGTMQAQASS
jgi:hypothetical protein